MTERLFPGLNMSLTAKVVTAVLSMSRFRKTVNQQGYPQQHWVQETNKCARWQRNREANKGGVERQQGTGREFEQFVSSANVPLWPRGGKGSSGRLSLKLKSTPTLFSHLIASPLIAFASSSSPLPHCLSFHRSYVRPSGDRRRDLSTTVSRRPNPVLTSQQEVAQYRYPLPLEGSFMFELFFHYTTTSLPQNGS